MIALRCLAAKEYLRAAIVFAALLANAACNAASASNPVSNGAMEEWSEGPGATPAGWRIAAGAGHFERSDRLKHSGRSSARFILAAPTATVLESVPQVDSRTDSLVSCSAWVHATRTRVRVHVSDGHSSARSRWHPSDGRWYQLTARIPEGASAVDVAIDISAPSIPAPDDFAWATYIDDAECHAVPRTFVNSIALFVSDRWEWAWFNVGNYWTFRSEAGGWAYPLIRTFDLKALRVFLEAAALALLLLWLTDGPFALPLWLRLAIWFAGAWYVQRLIGALAPDSLGSLIESDSANAFYSPTLHYSFREFLSHYLTLPLARHARTNMPGKVMFFYALQGLSHSTQVLAYAVILISNLGGLLMFAVARKLFRNDRAALYAMVFYLLIPGKICFFPLLNTVTPVFLLLSFHLWLCYLESRHTWYLAALGASLYWLLLFDPIPFALGLLFAGFYVAGWKDRRITAADSARVVVTTAGAFLIVHVCALAFLRFNIFHAFQAVVGVNNDFNEGRPYSVWVFGDLWEFLMSAGVMQSVLVLAFAATVLARLWRAGDGSARRAILTNPIHVLLLSYLASVLALDLLGLNRGETMRMWTFLTVFMAMIAAYLSVFKLPRSVIYVMVAATIFQTTATIYTVGVVLH